ncbi:GAF domain-containing protein [Halopseudomonas laoshanensis]|uniref:GAF domain-containing protein n=1 Tax=Halopseudomonas laoshanensis TaxID=2268758 RepID=UPI0037363402
MTATDRAISEAVTLANCEDEPIHLPGAIQPHGAMLAFNQDGTVVAYSENFSQLLGFEVVENVKLRAVEAGSTVMDLLSEGLAANGVWANSAETHLNGQTFDVVGHIHDNVVYLEFEPRPPVSASFSTFAQYAQRIITQVQMCNDVDTLLASVTEEIRRMTGYDRVMAYRFRPDQSGEVVAEARREDLVSYLGQRYPASDIPAQARRLYIQNPIRLIADVAYTSAAIFPARNPANGSPFDLSFSTLRSVSPIHCEYLSNMGVQASMSVSLVVKGKLWGLFACHHMAPKTLPHPVRMSFQVCSHVCSAMVERLEANRMNDIQHKAERRLAELVRQVREADDMLAALAKPELNIAELMPCDGAAAVLGGRILSMHGDFGEIALELIAELQKNENQDMYYSEKWEHNASDAASQRYCGVLAVRFHRDEGGWMLWFRMEEVHKVQWAGKPEKIVAQGPSGARLTPRGSFEAWEEVVRGRSAPWTEQDFSVAEKLRLELLELCLNRAAEIDRMRQRLIATLGHDLRNPLQSISMAAALLKSSDVRSVELREHITYSSSRMERLISQILEMSRLQAGSDIVVNCVPTDISQLVQAIVDETLLAYPDLLLDIDIQPGLQANVDPDRYAQVAVNLLSNARHHKTPASPVNIVLTEQQGEVRLTIRNAATPLSEAQLATLFIPFKQQTNSPERNKGGLGIGLYICSAIARAHGSRIDVQQAEGVISFSVGIPVRS